MKLTESVFREDEKATYKLRELYKKYGYSHYRVSKFEEYDLYAKNKSFLVSENLLTFTDTNGKLMALKPDVTLSIIKNAVADDKVSYKLYYDEHVYRTTTGGDGFREIMQTGLESIGNIDTYSQCEVIMLAMKSMENIADDYILDISHMSFLEGVLENAGVSSEDMAEFFSLMGSKNISDLKALCVKKKIAQNECDKLCALTAMYLPIDKALQKIEELSLLNGGKTLSAYAELCDVYEAIKLYGLENRLYLDFSVINDMNYYDGIIFKGFVNGIPDSILSGGRYDKVMARFGKNMGAIGFAVYLDKLERYGVSSNEYDVDVMLVYDENISAEKIISTVNGIVLQGKTVRTVKAPDRSVRCRELLMLCEEGVKSLETND